MIFRAGTATSTPSTPRRSTPRSTQARRSTTRASRRSARHCSPDSSRTRRRTLWTTPVPAASTSPRWSPPSRSAT
ncbi:hypothetical protein NKG94_50605 [Micromonospora sp. M12]